MSKKCIYCGNGYDEDFGHTDIVQELTVSKCSSRSGVYFGEEGFKKIKSKTGRNTGIAIARTVMSIHSESGV